MKNQEFSIRKRISSFKYAFNGLKILIKEEHNSRIHFLFTILLLLAGFLLKISPIEWFAIIFAIGFVVAMELINSSIENIADFISPNKDERIKKIKDLSAAAVLMSVLTAITIGLIIFIPKILSVC